MLTCAVLPSGLQSFLRPQFNLFYCFVDFSVGERRGRWKNSISEKTDTSFQWTTGGVVDLNCTYSVKSLITSIKVSWTAQKNISLIKLDNLGFSCLIVIHTCLTQVLNYEAFLNNSSFIYFIKQKRRLERSHGV